MKKNTVLIAVYGTLRQGECNHHYIERASSIRGCTFSGVLYDTGFGYPAVVLKGEKPVAAELAEISLEAWANVDRLEGYPRLYDRLLTDVTLETGETVQAWVYVMQRLPERAKVIECNDWKEYRKTRR